MFFKLLMSLRVEWGRGVIIHVDRFVFVICFFTFIVTLMSVCHVEMNELQ